MFWNVVVAEQVKIFKRRLFWVELVGLLALLAIQVVSRYEMAANGPSAQLAKVMPEAQQMAVADSTWPRAFAEILTDLSSAAWLAVIVLVGVLVAQEYTTHSLQLWLSHGVSRTTYLLAKAVALLVPVALLVALPLLAGSIAAGVCSLLLTGAINLGAADVARLGLAFVIVVFTLLPYAGLALLLAVSARSVIAPLGGGITLALVELVLLLSGNGLAAYLPRGLTSSLEGLVKGLFATGAPVVAAQNLTAQPAVLAPSLAAIGVALWLAAFYAVAITLLRRQDLTE